MEMREYSGRVVIGLNEIFVKNLEISKKRGRVALIKLQAGLFV
jgi:hypothetical protein